VLPYTSIGSNIHETIDLAIGYAVEGKCIVEGFVKRGSIQIKTFSAGLITSGNNISFDVVFECLICFPVEGTLISCIAKNINKAGIKAQSAEEEDSPIVVFVARDHNFNSNAFADVKEGDKFTARVIGQRFELNDLHISIIAEVVRDKQIYNKQT